MRARNSSVCRPSVYAGLDRVERLDQTRAHKVCLQQLARSRAAAVELLEMAVSLRVVVVGVDHDVARDALARRLAVATERYRDHDDLAESRGLPSR